MRARRILLVDDDEGALNGCVRALGTLPRCDLQPERRSTEALRRLGTESWDLLITDLRMPGADGMDLLKVARAHDPDLPVLVLTGYPTVDTAIEALKAGATDYLTKPFDIDELRTTVDRILRDHAIRVDYRVLERRLEGTASTEVVGKSGAIVEVLELGRRLARSDLDVLIVGETGTGKELFARRIHELTPGRSGRFVPVDCGAIPDDLMESEIFGYEKGAFTGADRRTTGLLEFADGGTFFLDEVQSLSVTLQAKLLRALQERRIRRVGSNHEEEVDVRVVAAMSVRPEKLVAEGRLREDLMYRLSVGRLEVPPLRERPSDVPLLVQYFLERYSREGQPSRVDDQVMAALCSYEWPGNVRQLQNAIRRALVTATGRTLSMEDLPGEIVSGVDSGSPEASSFFEARQAHMDAFERDFLIRALQRHGADVRSAAEAVDVPRGTFYRLLKKHGIQPKVYRAGHR